MRPNHIVRTLSQRLGREHPLIPLWIITTLFAGLISGTLGLLRFTVVCQTLCRPTEYDIYASTPGLADAIASGGWVAGGLAPLLVLIGHYILLRPTRQGWGWFSLVIPISFLTIFVTIMITTMDIRRTDLLNPISGMIVLGLGLIFMALAGSLAGASYGLATGVNPLSSIVWRSSRAWVSGWLLFAIAGFYGGGLLLSIGWLLCWGIVGWRSASVVAQVHRAVLSQKTSNVIGPASSSPLFHSIPSQKHIEVGCLLVDREARLLLVKPVDQAMWQLPGGLVHANESPLEGCVRTIRQSLHLDIDPGRLLIVEYAQSSQEQPEQLYFLFDGGFLSVNDTYRIHLRRDLLSAYQFVAPAALSHYVPAATEQRILQAVEAHQMKRTLYLERQ